MEIPAGVQGAVAWAKAHPVIAGGAVVGVIVLGYLASKALPKGLGAGDAEVLDPGLLAGEGGAEGIEEGTASLFPLGEILLPSGNGGGGSGGRPKLVTDSTMAGPLVGSGLSLTRSDVMLMVEPGVWTRPAGADRTGTAINPAGGIIGQPATAAHDTRLVGGNSIGARPARIPVSTAGPAPRPKVHGFSLMPASTAVAFATGLAQRTYAASSRTPKPKPAPPAVKVQPRQAQHFAVGT